MDAERLATIEAVQGDRVRLLLAARCSKCSGCGGRCDLFGAAGDARIELATASFDTAPAPGQEVRLYLPSAELLGHARRGYALPALGLLLGALCGHALASSLNAGPDTWSVLGAALGTLAGLGASKRATPPSCRACPITEAAGGDASVSRIECHEDRSP